MLQLFTYHIPFTKPFRIAGKEYLHREGIILVYKESEIEAYGEVAPLPGFSKESFDQVAEVLKMNREHLAQTIAAGDGEQTLQVLDQIHQFPSLSFGLDTLLHDLAAQRENKSLAEYLFPKFHSSILCNTVISSQDKNKTLSEAREKIKAGFRTLKLKVGSDFEQESEILHALRNSFPEINIRIDANGAWSAEEAIANLKSLEPLQLEYCEQPVPAHRISDLKAVKEAVKIPVAADESVRNKSSAFELSDNKVASILILKPMLMGTFKNIFVTKQLSDTHTIEVVFTSSLETAVGRASIAAIAAGLGNRNRAQGLATGALLEKDLSSDTWLNQPKIEFPKTSGLGISLHLEGLKSL